MGCRAYRFLNLAGRDNARLFLIYRAACRVQFESRQNCHDQVSCRQFMSDITLILEAIDRGEAKASEELLPVVYGELRRLAAARMAQEAAGQTLQPTALVHEAWLRLVGHKEQAWQNRAHFFGAAAEAMRRILIERARRKSRLKRGSNQAVLDISELELAAAGVKG